MSYGVAQLRSLVVATLASAVPAAGCRTGDYAQATVGLGAAVAVAGASRAITGGCWARCDAGFICNRTNGLCEEGECVPACSVGQACERELDGKLRCVEDLTAFTPGARAGSAVAAPDSPTGEDRQSASDASAPENDPGSGQGAGTQEPPTTWRPVATDTGGIGAGGVRAP
jgi:hypothetical protein